MERPVLRGTYKGLTVISMPPPSSGGTGLIEMLNVLEGFRLKAADDPDAERKRLLEKWDREIGSLPR